MIKKTVTYTDFDGNSRTDELYFNLTKLEAMEFALGLPDGMTEDFSGELTEANAEKFGQKFADRLGAEGILNFVKSLVLKSYGKKSKDGKTIDKSPEVIKEFVGSNAFSDFMIELMTSDTAAAEFVNGVIPEELAVNLPSNLAIGQQ